MSSTRVMATTSLMGQAVGTAAAIAARTGTTPRGVYQSHLQELQAALMDDDCWLPWHTRPVPSLARAARLSADSGDPEPLRSGVDRPIGDTPNAWTGPLGSALTYELERPERISAVRLVGDSNLCREMPSMPSRHHLVEDRWHPPESLLKAFRIEVQASPDTWRVVHEETNNYQRLVRIPLSVETRAVRLVPTATWGADHVRLFAFEIA